MGFAIPLVLPVTQKCNLNCTYCSVQQSERKNLPDIKNEIILNNYNKIRKKHPFETLELFATGGEPLINWDAINQIDSIKEKDQKTICSVTTNGTLTDRVINLAKKDWEIRVSHNGIFNEINRGKTKDAERTLLLLSKIPEAEYLVRMTIDKNGFDYLENSFKDLSERLKVKKIVIGEIVDYKTREHVKKELINDSGREKIMNLAKNYGLEVIIISDGPCDLATHGYCVFPDGRLSICSMKYTFPSKELRDKAKKQGCLIKPYL